MIFSRRYFSFLLHQVPYVKFDPFIPRSRSKGEKARNRKFRK